MQQIIKIVKRDEKYIIRFTHEQIPQSIVSAILSK